MPRGAGHSGWLALALAADPDGRRKTDPAADGPGTAGRRTQTASATPDARQRIDPDPDPDPDGSTADPETAADAGRIAQNIIVTELYNNMTI